MLIASHARVRLDGVCDQPPCDLRDDAAEERVLVGVGGGETALVGEAWFALEARVARLRGEESCDTAVAVSGSGNSFGWFRVATMFAVVRTCLRRCAVVWQRKEVVKCDDKDELCADEAEGYGCTCGRVPELSPASSTVWSTTTDVMPSATSQASPDERRLRRQRSSPIKGDQRSAVSDSYLHSAHVVVILCWDVLRLCTAIAGAYALSRTSSIYSNLSSCPW